MNHRLSPIVDSIMQGFSALENLDSHLLSRNKEDSFSNRVHSVTKSLPEDDKIRIDQEFFGWGPLQSLWDRNDIFDIMIGGSQNIFYEDSQGLHIHKDQFISEQTFQLFLERICERSGTVVDLNHPFASSSLGPFRVHIAIPPAANQITLTLRRHSQTLFPLSLLQDQGFLNHWQLNYLRDLLNDRKNFLVVGPTGSGKTTFLNSLISEIPDSERMVIVEDTSELKVPSPLSCKLLTREHTDRSLKPVFLVDLIKQSLRMRPDRLVVGEVRGGEAKDLLQALATGHSGSMGTLHSRSAQEALLRLEMMVQMGAPQWSLYSVRQLIHFSLDAIIVLKENRMKKGILQICEIKSHEKFGLLLEEISDDSVV